MSEVSAKRLRKALEDRERRGLESITFERLGHAGGSYAVVPGDQAMRVRQSALDMLAGREKLDERCVKAADRFARDAHDGGMVRSRCALDRSDTALDNSANARWGRAVRALPAWALSQVENIIWPLDSGIGAGAQLEDRLAAIDVGAVKAALGLLADHYQGRTWKRASA